MTKMKYEIRTTARFRKDLRKLAKQHKDLGELEDVIRKLANGEKLEPKYRDHQLINGNGLRDCHIEPDWVLLYEYIDSVLVLSLIRTGSHSDLEI